jgi:hypothetical protein
MLANFPEPEAIWRSVQSLIGSRGATSPRANKVVVAIYALLLIVATGCGEKIPERYRSFFELSMEQQQDSILSYPIQEQLDMYLIGTGAIRPPPIYLLNAIARNGPTAIPSILARLRTVDDSFDKADLIQILEYMECFERVDVRKDPRTVESIKDAIATIRIEAARHIAQGALATIEDGCTTKKAQAKAKYSELLRNRR